MNIVHLMKLLNDITLERSELVNHLATSKEDILAASRELIKENGWTALSIRAVASRCSVSAGTIYNYYESKAELLGDTIESIWREIFLTLKMSRFLKMLLLVSHGFIKDCNMEMSNFRASFHCIRLDL